MRWCGQGWILGMLALPLVDVVLHPFGLPDGIGHCTEIVVYFPPGFDLVRARELARLVMQAYDQLGSFQRDISWRPKDGYSLVTELVQESAVGSSAQIRTQFDPELKLLRGARLRKSVLDPIGFVVQRGDSVYVTFRGTVSVTEWVRNLNVRLSDYPEADYGRVHEGFLQTYTLVRPALLEALSRLEPRKKLFMVGHSLGAALATLALPDIARSTQFKSPSIYTFGSPRVGDSQFSRTFGRMFAYRSFRIVNTSDMITSLPLPVPILGIIGGYFSHVDTPVDFNVQNDDSEKNHKMETYLSALCEAQRERGIWKALRRLKAGLGKT